MPIRACDAKQCQAMPVHARNGMSRQKCSVMSWNALESLAALPNPWDALEILGMPWKAENAVTNIPRGKMP